MINLFRKSAKQKAAGVYTFATTLTEPPDGLRTVSELRSQVFVLLEAAQYKLTPPDASGSVAADYDFALPPSMNSAIFRRPSSPVIMISSPVDRNPTSLDEIVLTRIAGGQGITPLITSITLGDLASQTLEMPQERRFALFVAGQFKPLAHLPKAASNPSAGMSLVL
jgi:hypothetical protein